MLGGGQLPDHRPEAHESWQVPRGPGPPAQDDLCDSEATEAGQGYPGQRHSQSCGSGLLGTLLPEGRRTCDVSGSILGKG